MNTSELVQPRHLIRSAEIYVRQSSPNQVLTNKESQRMQYALRDCQFRLETEPLLRFGWRIGCVFTGGNSTEKNFRSFDGFLQSSRFIAIKN